MAAVLLESVKELSKKAATPATQRSWREGRLMMRWRLGGRIGADWGADWEHGKARLRGTVELALLGS